MSRKVILLDLIARAYAEEKRFIAALTREERSRAGTLDQWAAKDVIAHNAAWKGRMAENLLAVSEGGAPQRGEDFDFDRENAALFEEHRAKSWDEVLALADRAYLGLVEQIDGLGEDELASCEVFHWQKDRPLWRLIVGTGYNHPYIHMAEHYRNRGDSVRAGELIGEMAKSLVDLDDSPTWQGVVRYNVACHYSLLGHKGAAINELRAALELNPELEGWSKQDPDLDPIRGEPGYQSIYETGLWQV